MNRVITAPDWAPARAQATPESEALRQLVNVAGPMASGMAVALTLIQRADFEAQQGAKATILTSEQRQALINLCWVSCQVLEEVAEDACNAYLSASLE